MAIVTKPADFIKGTPATYTLNKGDLAADLIVAADSYFSIQTNWKKVSVIMKSTTGGQTKPLLFNAVLATPTAEFNTSLTARDDFEVDRLTIFDFDGGQLTLLRGDLNTADFDISVFAAPPVTLVFEPTFAIDMLSGTPAGTIFDQTTNTVSASRGEAIFNVGESTGWTEYTVPSPLAIGQTGALHFDIDFRETGSFNYTFGLSDSSASTNNKCFITQNSNNSIQFLMYDSTGTIMINDSSIIFVPTPGVYYNFAMEWDFDVAGNAKFYIDSGLQATVAQSGGTVRTDTTTHISPGTTPDKVGQQISANRIKNLKIYTESQLS